MDAESTTKSGVAAGTIEVTDKDKQKQDVDKLNRDTKNTLNKLEQIFDKKTVQERQELAKVFGEVAYKEVHRISNQYGWAEGSPEKIALHALIGGIMAQLGGGDFASGATAAGINEAIQNELSKIKDPALHQWASAIVGAAVAEAMGGDAQTGASTSASGTKNNTLEEELAAQRGEDPTNVTAKSVEDTILANGDTIQIVNKDGQSVSLGKDIGITVLTANAAEGIKQVVVNGVQKSITYGTFYTNHGALDYAVDLTPTTTVIMTGMVNMGVVENGMTLLINYSQMNTLEEFAKRSTIDITTGLLSVKAVHAGFESANINAPIILITTTGAVVGLLVSNKLLNIINTGKGDNNK